jgi:hypothetical protein
VSVKTKVLLGRIVASHNVLDQDSMPDIFRALARHQSGDWGGLEEADRKANDVALVRGSRLLSAYGTAEGIRFWVITEHDRTVTTALLNWCLGIQSRITFSWYN